MHNVHATQVTSSPMFMKPRPGVLFMVPKGLSKSKHQHLFTSPGLKVYQKQRKLILHQVLSGNMLLNYGSSSLPKLQLKKFDGDPLQWPDWSSMIKSIVRDADLSLNGKIQHLQNSVVGRAKSTKSYM